MCKYKTRGSLWTHQFTSRPLDSRSCCALSISWCSTASNKAEKKSPICLISPSNLSCVIKKNMPGHHNSSLCFISVQNIGLNKSLHIVKRRQFDRDKFWIIWIVLDLTSVSRLVAMTLCIPTLNITIALSLLIALAVGCQLVLSVFSPTTACWKQN